MNLVYQDMLMMQEQNRVTAAKAQKRQYEYDSDEDTEVNERHICTNLRLII